LLSYSCSRSREFWLNLRKNFLRTHALQLYPYAA